MKRLISIFLVLSIAISMLTIPAAAATKVWSGKDDTSWYTGKKKEYNISTPEQLAGLSKLVNSGKTMEGITINLTADLVMNNTEGWTDWYKNPPKRTFTPIGHTGDPVGGYYPFCGLFNGNGHSISGLYVNSGVCAGLFGYLWCAGVTDLIIEKSVIIGYDNRKNKGAYAGAIAGIADGSVISRCQNDGYVYCQGQKDIASGMRYANGGGIVGSIHTENLTGVACWLTFAAMGYLVNPVVISGGNGVIKNSVIVNCANGGAVYVDSGVEAHLGGIAGNADNGIIKNCLSYCGFNATGGNNNRGTCYYGGIAGVRFNCSLDNCYYWSTNEKLKSVGYSMFTVVDGIINNTKRVVSREDVMSKELVKALGSEFVYKSKNPPHLACDLRFSSSSSVSSDKTTSSKPKATVKNGKATLSWSKQEDAVSYNVYRLNSDGEYTKLGSTKKTSLTIKNIKSGKKYTIRIKAKLSDGTYKTIKNGDFSFTG